MFSRPGVLIHSFIHRFIKRLIPFLQIFKTPSFPNCMSSGPEIFRECLPPFKCHMSYVTCHVSHVMCHMSHLVLDKVVELVGGGSVINGAYPV